MSEQPAAEHDLPVERVRHMRAHAARVLRPMPYEDDLSEWRAATLEEKGRALAGLLHLVKAIGHYPPKQTQFPGWRRIIAGRAEQDR